MNINVGVVGHVDSGKTSLVRALSTHLSTAALDKDPQSQQRGITLDLGFSSFRLKPRSSTSVLGHPCLQVTLVDCPGHASLFQTILSGVAIIDSVVVVVDCRKGLQAQTIESLLLTSLIAKRNVIAVLTKTDLLPPENSEKIKAQNRVIHEIRSFMATHFNYHDIPIVSVVVGTGQEPQGIEQLLDVLRGHLQVPERDASGPFRLAVDHCFAVSGNGTVLTGTVLSGTIAKGDDLEVLPLGIQTKVKTLQVFKRDVHRCVQGDRVGVCVKGVDPALVKRAIVASPIGSLPPVTQVVIPVTRVPFFRGGACKSGAKCHATVGHTTVIAIATFFSRLGKSDPNSTDFDPLAPYEFAPSLDFTRIAHETGQNESTFGQAVFALLQFEHAVFCPPKTLIVCSRLDLNAKQFPCRLAFYGAVNCVVGLCDEELRTLRSVHQPVVSLDRLRIGRVKHREGYVDKVMTSNGKAEEVGDVIGRDMFSKDVKWSVYQNFVVLFDKTHLLGSLCGPFGKAGKFRIALDSESTVMKMKPQLKPVAGEKLVMRFLKIMKLKAPKLKGKAKSFTSTTTRSTSKVAVCSFVQDCNLLYPEAFRRLPAVEEGSANVATFSRRDAVQSKRVNDLIRIGIIERLKGQTSADGRNPFAVVSGLFSTEQEATRAVGSRIRCLVDSCNTLDGGTIEKAFGKAGKVRVDFQECGGTKAQLGDKVEWG